MKFHADLHLFVYLGKPEEALKMVERSAELGYDAVGMTFAAGARQEEIQKMREVCSTASVDLVTRVNLTPRNSADMLGMLRNLRRRFELISVRCYSKAVARQAAKDQRVDLISFPSTDFRRRFFDSAEAQLASEASASLEVEMAPLLCVQGLQRSRLLSFLRKEVLTAKKFSVPIVLSSGAKDARLLRKPADYAFLSFLFGLGLHEANQALSENPRAIIERNRRKLSSDYVAPGVYVIRRRKDCPGI